MRLGWRLSLVLVVSGLCMRASAQSPAVPISPSSPPDLTVTVGPGEISLGDGKTAKVPAAVKLTFDPPEVRSAELKAKAPRDYADWYTPWEPWPGKGKDGVAAAIMLKPASDENGVLILGGLFRSIRQESVVVTSADGANKFQMGGDYKYLADWAQIANWDGRLGEANIAELKITYQYALQRLDLVQVDAAGKVSVKKGRSSIVCPALPEADAGAAPVAGVYIAPWTLAENPNLSRPGAATAPAGTGAKAAGDYVITKFEICPIRPAAPVAPVHPEAVAGTLQKLKDGQAVTVAIMGASIELGAEACAWWDDKIKFTDQDLAWRGRLIVGLRKRFPKATIKPVEAYQGGTQTKFGLDVLEKTVLPAKPDVVLIGFGGNDVAGPIGRPPNNPPEQFKKDMQAMVRKAKAGGAEVVLVVTMQQNPWQKTDVDGRWPAYRKALLEIGDEEKVGVADVYTEWLNLATRGIPPVSQLHNWVNHPGAFGHGVYAETVLRFFPE
jgi:lysophospholipase L1-like esterase